MSNSDAIEITDLEDLEDQIQTLKDIVSCLNLPSLSRAEIEMHMGEYVILEETILQGIKHLEKSLIYGKEKSNLDVQVELFNTLGCDYQDTWNDLYWSCYEMIKEGSSQRSLNPLQQINRLQGLALVMNKKKKKDLVVEQSQALEEVDELSKKFKEGMEPEPVSRKKCCDCCVM